jgi:hypothetical protein
VLFQANTNNETIELQDMSSVIADANADMVLESVSTNGIAVVNSIKRDQPEASIGKIIILDRSIN